MSPARFRFFQQAVVAVAVASSVAAAGDAFAQAHLRERSGTSTPSVVVPPGGDPMAVPGFWDPRRRPERPDLTRIQGIRFLTEIDYPPFNYAGADGQPAGFNVDLARAICEEIKVPCTIQFRRFDTLLEALATNGGDAIIASMAATPDMRRRVDFSDPYYRPPARFVSRKDVEFDEVRPGDIEARKVGVVAGTAHEAYLRALFTEAEVVPYPGADDARGALKRGEVDLLFGDGVALAFWLNGTDSAGCCVFRGGPYIESRFFGEGVGVAVRRGNDVLRQAINWALFRIWEKGKFTDLWLRYFPISPF
ncbi:MAG: transporter substrate-binding domain-containing protein [Pseudolabrys sp.]